MTPALLKDPAIRCASFDKLPGRFPQEPFFPISRTTLIDYIAPCPGKQPQPLGRRQI
jgi:hypothetical protein